MANILDYLRQIKDAVYGKDVRSSIYNALYEMNDQIEKFVEIPDGSVTPEKTTFVSKGTDGKYVLSNDFKINDDIATLEQDLLRLQEQIGHGGSGLSDSAKALLITILRNAIYSTNQSDNITLLESSLSGGDDTPTEPTTPTLTGITVIWLSDSADVGTDPRTLISSVKANYSDGTSHTVTEYTVSPSSIVEGPQTVTVIYNSKTATKIITGNSAVVSPAYSLPSPVTFDGTNVVETRYRLIGDTDRDWTIMCEFNPTVRNGFVFDSSKNGSGAISLKSRGDYFREFYVVSKYHTLGNDINSVYKLVATHIGGSNDVIVKSVNGSNKIIETAINLALASNSNYLFQSPIVLGTNYTKSDMNFRGMISKFDVYESVVSDDMISDFLGV